METTEIKLEENDFIPVDEAIKSFKIHLQTHPRTILSAKYGDGKTVFLKKFAENEEINNEYLVLHLYPVNYQVCDNKDIFELVKYDILLQLLVHKIDLSIKPISDSILWSYYIQNNGLNILETIFKRASSISPNIEMNLLTSCIIGSKSLQNFCEKFDVFKQKHTDEGKVLSFLEKNKNSFIYESDVITSIIKNTIKTYRENTRKKVVLVFDDMDRMDPAHLFRIMNVLSAHVDSYNNTTEGNKFGVDNIVLVLHYKNLNNIFRHFYGADVDINGYVSKFVDKGYFEYSLNKQKNDYLYEIIHKATEMPLDLLKAFLPLEIFLNKSVRDIMASTKDIEDQIIDDEKYTITPNRAILRFFVICRRLGLDKHPNIGSSYYSLSSTFYKIFDDKWREMIEINIVYFVPKIDYDQPFEMTINNCTYHITIKQDDFNIWKSSSHGHSIYNLSELYNRLMSKIAP